MLCKVTKNVIHQNVHRIFHFYSSSVFPHSKILNWLLFKYDQQKFEERTENHLNFFGLLMVLFDSTKM